MGILQKTANFLGISKFGKGIASAGRQLTGQVASDTENQLAVGAQNQRVLYALKNETDPIKKKHLQDFMQRQNFGDADVSTHGQRSFAGTEPTAASIDPGLSLSTKEVLGSAANTALNVTGLGSVGKGIKSFSLAKAAMPVAKSFARKLGENVALGTAFGTAQGLEKDRSASGVLGSAVAGAGTMAGLTLAGAGARAVRDFIGEKVPEWMMNKAVKPALNDLRKNVKYGTDTLGKELLDEGVKGGPKKLLQIADSRQSQYEHELESILNHPGLSQTKIDRQSIYPHLREIVSRKAKVPGGRNDILKLKELYNDLPESMTLAEANDIKRAIYKELRDPAYKLDVNLGTKAETLKMIAHGLKQGIEDAVPDAYGGIGVKELNKKLSIYGRLENSMVDQLARNMRNNGIGLTDAILASGGGPMPILALIRHLGKSVETHTAQALHKTSKIGTGILGKTIKAVGEKAILNAP